MEILRRVERLATARGLRERDDNPAAHEMQVLAGYPQLTAQRVN